MIKTLLVDIWMKKGTQQFTDMDHNPVILNGEVRVNLDSVKYFLNAVKDDASRIVFYAKDCTNRFVIFADGRAEIQYETGEMPVTADVLDTLLHVEAWV